MNRCLYCNQENIHGSSLFSYLFNHDIICDSCRSLFRIKRNVFMLNGLKIEGIYVYDDNFKNLLLQYKEANDEALAPIFLSELRKDFLIRYRNYQIVLAPSSKNKENIRGFNHLKLMFDSYGIDTLDLFEKMNNVNQKDLVFDDRKKILDNIKLKKENKLKKVLVVDDVVTSGYTMLAISKLLAEKCDEIKYFTLAYNKKYEKNNSSISLDLIMKIKEKSKNYCKMLKL